MCLFVELSTWPRNTTKACARSGIFFMDAKLPQLIGIFQKNIFYLLFCHFENIILSNNLKYLHITHLTGFYTTFFREYSNFCL